MNSLPSAPLDLAGLRRYYRDMAEDTTETVDIDQLERLLKSYDDVPIEIRPNGEIRIKGTPSIRKPLTMKANLGGEYCGRCPDRVWCRWWPPFRAPRQVNSPHES